jgi:hypothetical protein
LAEYILKDEKGLIESDKSSFKVRLTKKGRKLWQKGLVLPIQHKIRL